MTRLRFDNATRDQIALLVEWHDHRIQTQRGLRRALSQLGEENLRLLLALQRADNLGQAPAYQPRRQAELTELEQMLEQLLAEDTCFSLRQLAVNGPGSAGAGIPGRRGGMDAAVAAGAGGGRRFGQRPGGLTGRRSGETVESEPIWKRQKRKRKRDPSA